MGETRGKNEQQLFRRQTLPCASIRKQGAQHGGAGDYFASAQAWRKAQAGGGRSIASVPGELLLSAYLYCAATVTSQSAHHHSI